MENANDHNKNNYTCKFTDSLKVTYWMLVLLCGSDVDCWKNENTSNVIFKSHTGRLN